MSGRAETRTPEPPDRDEHEKSPPRLLRPRRTTRPRNNYDQEQEIEIQQRNARSQQKKRTRGKPVAQREAMTSDDASTESDDTNAANLVKELVKLRRDIKRRDDSHREEMQKVQEELQKVKEEFSAALAEVQQELQTLAERPLPEPCARNSHDEILREVQSLREEISTPRPRKLPVLYTSKITESESEKASAGSIRATIEIEIRKMDDHTHWRCRAVTVSPRDTNRIRIACRDEAEHQLVKKVAEAKIGAGARVLRDELYPIKVDSVKRTAVLDENHEILTGAAAAMGEENETTVAKMTWLSNKEIAKPYGSMVVYLTKGTDARRILADGYFYVGGESGTTSVFEYRPRPVQCYNCQEVGHKAFQCKKIQKCAKCATEGHHHSHCDHTVPNGVGDPGTLGEVDSRPALDLPDGTSQMDQDGALHLEGREMGNPKHALAAVIRLPERLVFIASVYVEGGEASALSDACDRLRKAITKVRRDIGTVVEIMITGDLTAMINFGEGTISLLKRGTKTWHGGGHSGDCESTIDLVLASENLTDSMIKCAILGTDHGSDHDAIKTVFDFPWPIPKYQERLLLKNAPWNEINARIASTLAAAPSEGTV
ncbi:hypothetical protein N7505_007368 [Penicillium chrysogenum]|uniref:CCHC-type domain-containing protein n=1 Tax=Penicillium chrysogenum TaxID=5076 RepID=A0ABQ8WD94_PENCH|nr:hypothetical protein N7505_007368 [Penicillium chrysogenum]